MANKKGLRRETLVIDKDWDHHCNRYHPLITLIVFILLSTQAHRIRILLGTFLAMAEPSSRCEICQSIMDEEDLLLRKLRH